jgi:DNA mismatch repair protein MutS2
MVTATDAESFIASAEFGGDVLEVDLHAQTGKEAELSVEQALSRAYAAREPVLKIIHGRGSGALQETVRRVLAGHPLVETWRPSFQAEEVGAVMYVAIAL